MYRFRDAFFRQKCSKHFLNYSIGIFEGILFRHLLNRTRHSAFWPWHSSPTSLSSASPSCSWSQCYKTLMRYKNKLARLSLTSVLRLDYYLLARLGGDTTISTMALSITTLSVMTLSVRIKNTTLSIQNYPSRFYFGYGSSPYISRSGFSIWID